MPQVKSVFFGVSPASYDNGRTPSCAINAGNLVVEVHQGESESTLNYRIGQVSGVQLTWQPKVDNQPTLGNGNNPAVALADDNVVVVMWDAGGALRYSVGKVNGNQINVSSANVAIADNNTVSNPSVAVNEDGIVIVVYQSVGPSTGGNTPPPKVVWRRGKLTGQTLTWDAGSPNVLADNGTRPSVTLDKSGLSVVVFEVNGTRLFYSLGQLNAADTEPWTTPKRYDTGTRPSVALSDDKHVFEVHQLSDGLFQGVGLVRGDRTEIEWQDFLATGEDSYRFDLGREAQIAANGKVGIQVHADEVEIVHALFANASLIFDRANWIGDHRNQLKNLTLRGVALPASHDAGAFAEQAFVVDLGRRSQNFARTQDLSIGSQLAYGIRYFDLRPIYTGDRNQPVDTSKFFTYHDIPSGDYLGPRFTEVIGDVRQFLPLGPNRRQEFVILKISHYRNFNQAVFNALIDLIVDRDNGLGRLLYVPANRNLRNPRIADRKLERFFNSVLIFADVDANNGNTDYVTTTGDRSHLSQGIFRYRDWYAADPQNGDLTVFDLFSETFTFAEMATSTQDNPSHEDLPGSNKKVPRGQLNKFVWFDGLCQGRQSRSGVQCDLFLLSWTLTPLTPSIGIGTAFKISANANRNLVDFLARTNYQYDGKTVDVRGPNTNGQRINLLFTDGVEFSRSVDVAMVRNGLV